MTSEIALLNRTAIALAADSAVTTRYWDWSKGENVTRYFKGANKIFNLSAMHPVGLMVYDSGSIQRVPIEVLVKSYRHQLGKKSHDHLASYAVDFFEYLTSNGDLYPSQYQETVFLKDVATIIQRIFTDITVKDEFKSAPDDDAKREAAAGQLKITSGWISKEPLINPSTADDVANAVAKYEKMVLATVYAEAKFKDYLKIINFDAIVPIAINALFTARFTALDTTGIVVAGFGEKDFFPRLVSYRCYGIVLGKLLYDVIGDEIRICHENISGIVPFAQDKMVRTFMHGVSMDAFGHIADQSAEILNSLEAELKRTGKLKADENIEDIKAAENEKFVAALAEHFNDQHHTPLRRVIGMLPVDELAELAETLISIESMKERVTKPSSSVSGPIDVALISKGDGFIWVKRKHYFDAELNPRFFSRRTVQVTE